ncbi:MAG: tRNA (adenosine(37)-N6)-threonylcarbamoyltransferase complex dimerization subunit type 1 TsaB [Erysipelotrichaceae bacterium]|nr:tRNA (adenosine(37)-N6)-threonylcarbamoyltransferase complex dimerization subunit type 1 TsaB [Erysipelotrichaceae bacterium]
MLVLCVDTSYKALSISLLKDGEIIKAYDEFCFKHQSEMLFIKMQELFKAVNMNPLDIDAICISKGPGSYTGVRIAMSMAKTICAIEPKIKLYTISTLKLYSNNRPNALVIMDARANRAYLGVYDKCQTVINDCIVNNDQINFEDYELIGDLSLFGREDKYYPISECFKNCFNSFEEVEEIAYLVPSYLKESDAYLSAKTNK